MARMLLLTLLIALTASIVVGPGFATSAARDASVAGLTTLPGRASCSSSVSSEV